MGDPLFLDQVELALNQEANKENVLMLLELVSPRLRCLGSKRETDKIFKVLLARVHPDKHPQDIARATQLCQNVQTFYATGLLVSSSTKDSNKREAGASSPRSTAFPKAFSVHDK
jgi:hypothetical protein